MNVALVHDYLNEYGGAERVLAVLSEMFPEAPIYTAFYKEGSAAYEYFKKKRIIPSWAHSIPGFQSTSHSPLRFLAPLIWESFDFTKYDLVISSSSWYMTKGIVTRPSTRHISYIHTPPRYLYGYSTSLNFQKHKLVRMYAGLVNKGLRQYDYLTASRPDVLVANSKEVQARIKKFWRRESTVIYPPVGPLHPGGVSPVGHFHPRGGYYLTGGRLVGPKHFDLAIHAANELKVPLKVFGVGPFEQTLRRLAGSTVSFLGKVDEATLATLYAGAIAFIALADDEDFGITPVEAMMAGTPVIAYRSGGYLESVVEGKTGTFVDALQVDEVIKAIQRIANSEYRTAKIQEWAERFSRTTFEKEMNDLISQIV